MTNSSPENGFQIPFAEGRCMRNGHLLSTRRKGELTKIALQALQEGTNDELTHLSDELSTSRVTSADLLDHAAASDASTVNEILTKNSTEIQNAKRNIAHTIQNGRFGMCAICNAEIPTERVRAVPYNPYCIKHA